MTDETKNTTQYTDIVVSPSEDSEVVITGALTTEAVASARKSAIDSLGAHMEIDGFRKGHIPESVVVERLGEQAILEKVAEELLQKNYASIVMENKLQVIGQPAVEITKLAPGNPIEFKITTAVMPEVTLPDYEKIAKEKREEAASATVEVSDEELEQTILNIRKRHAAAKRKELNPEGEVDPESIEESELAALDDEIVKEFGAFTSIEDFRTKLREHLLNDKQTQAREKRRGALADALVGKTTVVVPKIFVESELDKMVADMEAQISRMGLTFESYLEHVQKTREGLRDEWREEARKRSVLQLVLASVAREKKIRPEEKRLEREVAHILEHYKDADPDSVRMYVDTLMTNDLVFTYLEEGTLPSSDDSTEEESTSEKKGEEK